LKTRDVGIGRADIDGSNLQEGIIPGGSGEVNAMAVGGQ